ncbi:MAG: FAD-binding oxidoreductase, partial [Pricia sp.]|nr:FAD-binding oxidoreductase [Pricia sp.]
LLYPVFGTNAFQLSKNRFQFQKVKNKYITHVLEGQLDTGKMMTALTHLVQSSGTIILNGVRVENFMDNRTSVTVKTEHFEYTTRRLMIATNGFASELLKEDVKPARAQVVVTKPIKQLRIKGTFHLDEGYYYFRNVDNRILLGGGRNLDFATEETTQFGETERVQNQLEKLLGEVILPDASFEIEQRWSGIMGVGPQKLPIVKQLSDSVYCAVRLGGMGIAIGSKVGEELVDLI